jgi:tellurite resistance protein TerC
VTHVTPLSPAPVLVEIADVISAIDPVPAIFAIATGPFIACTSNVPAIPGLRALYFAPVVMAHRFHHLKYALAAVLIVVGLQDLPGRPPGPGSRRRRRR